MIDDGPHENMDIDMNTRNGTSIVTMGDSSGHDTRPNAPIPIDMAMPDYPEFSPTPGEPISTDMGMPDHPGLSPTLEVQSTTHRRLNIMSLCNPNNEDPDVRPHCADTLFDKTLEPVRVPLRSRGCSCESIYIYIYIKTIE